MYLPVQEKAREVRAKLPPFLESCSEDRATAYQEWLEMAKACENCVLYTTRNHVAIPDGTLGAKIMFVGNSPGYLEDLAGKAFVSPTSLRTAKCGTCKKVDICFEEHMLPNLRTFKKRIKSFVECSYEESPFPVLQDRFYMRSVGSVIDGILGLVKEGKFPRQSWLDLNYPKKGMESVWMLVPYIMCRPFDKTTMAEYVPSTLSVRECGAHIFSLWSILQPKVCVAAGIDALRFFVGKEKAEKGFYTPGETIDTKYGPVIYTEDIAKASWDRDETSKGLRYARIIKAMEDALDIADVN